MAKTGSKLRAYRRLPRGMRTDASGPPSSRASGGAELSSDVLAALLSSMHSGILVENDEGTITLVNSVLLRDLEVDATPAQLVGGDMRDIDQAFGAHVIDADQVLHSAEQLRQAALASRGEIVRFVDGRVLERDYSPLVRDGRVRGHLWHYRDITERVAATQELESQNETLKELDRTKDDFVALVSHELRTPLTSILGYLEVGFPEREDLPEIQRDALETMGRNADRLLRLVNDLLFVAQLDAGGPSIQPGAVDLTAIASESVENQRSQAETKGIALLADIHGPLWASGDDKRLVQLADNLVANAINFTPSGGSVTVRVGDDPDGIRFEVQDTGIGIPAAEQAHLFDRFFRATNASERAIPGTGLGLAIVRAIVDAHAGTVEVDSQEGVGSTFRVTLPRSSHAGPTFEVPAWEGDRSVGRKLDGIVEGARP